MKVIYVMLAGLCLLCLPALSAEKAAGDGDLRSKVKGKWEVVIPDAPYGYQNYTLDIKEKEKTIYIDVKGGDVNLKDQKFTEKDGKLSANLYVGEYVKVTLWEEKGKVKGTAYTTMGELSCNLKKIEKK